MRQSMILVREFEVAIISEMRIQAANFIAFITVPIALMASTTFHNFDDGKTALRRVASSFFSIYMEYQHFREYAHPNVLECHL